MEKAPRATEHLERSIDHELAEILSTAELAGFGANGFVFRVAGDKIPGRFAEDLKELGETAEVPADVAMKMLKVYEAGTAAREVAMHQKAWEVLREHAGDPDYASVPRVYFAHTAHFTSQERQHLTELGFKVGASADIILMDFVPGRDLKEILAEQVMERSENATPSQIQKTTNPDDDYRYAFLQKRGFSVHPNIAQRIERAVQALNRAGVFHRDLHEANIMIDGAADAPDSVVSIIDFGRADTAIRREHEEKAVDDLMVVRRIREHQPEAAGQPSEDELLWRSDLERFRDLSRTHQLYQQFRVAFMANHEQALASLRVGDERTLSQVAVQLLGALEEKLISVHDAKEVVTRLKAESRLIPIQRKLDWFLRYLGSQR